MSDQNKNPFLYFWDLATGGLLSVSSNKELTPNKQAGKESKTSKQQLNKPLQIKTTKKAPQEPSKKLKQEG